MKKAGKGLAGAATGKKGPPKLPGKPAVATTVASTGVATTAKASPPVVPTNDGVDLASSISRSYDVLDTINRFSEEYLAGLIDDDVLLDERVRQEMPMRLEALQQQLDKLELESFVRQREEMIAAGQGEAFEANDALMASVNAKASQTEISLGTLKKRLTEMHQKLVSRSAPVPTPTVPTMTTRKFPLPAKVRPGEFPATEGEAYDDSDDDDSGEGVDDYFGSDFESDEFMDEVEVGILRSAFGSGLPLDMKQIISAAQKDMAGNDSTTLVSKAEGEVQVVLEVLTSPGLTLEEKIQAVQGKLRDMMQQDQYWRSQADKLNRRIHDLRLQKRLTEMERDRLRSINGRLEGFCKDLQGENRKMKIEAVKVEEAMKTAIEIAAAAPNSPPAPSCTAAGPSKKKKKGKEVPASPLFELPEIPGREALETEDKATLVNRLLGMADVYRAREAHFASISEGREIEAKVCDTKIAQQQVLLERTINKLDLGETRVNELARSEAELKIQVRQYVEKFRQVEETLVKSNELFGTFRGEMEQMSLKLARFERENHQMQTKCQTLSRNIIEMADERAKLQGTIETLKAQKGKLEQLCRTLQAERSASKKPSDETGANDAAPSEEPGEEPPSQ